MHALSVVACMLATFMTADAVCYPNGEIGNKYAVNLTALRSVCDEWATQDLTKDKPLERCIDYNGPWDSEGNPQPKRWDFSIECLTENYCNLDPSNEHIMDGCTIGLYREVDGCERGGRSSYPKWAFK